MIQRALLILFLTTLCAGLASAADEPAGGTPKIVCDEPAFDFGQADNTGHVEHTYVIKNAGDALLEIKKTKTSCGCTVANVSNRKVAPGEAVDITVRLNLRGRRGSQRKNVTVESNDPAQPKLTLTISGTAVAHIEVKPPRIYFGQVLAGEKAERTLDVISDREDFHITRVDSELQTEVETVTENRQYRIKVTKDASTSGPGPIRGALRIHTDSTRAPLLQVPVTGSVVGQLGVAPDRIVLANRQGRPETRYVIVRPGLVKDFKILEVIPPEESIGTKVFPMGPQGYRIQLNNLVGSDALNGKRLVIKTDVETMASIEVPFEYRR